MGSVRKKGNRWYFSVELPTENGKRKRIEKAGGKTKKEALEKMKVFEAEILKNGYQEKSKMTFKELFDIWYEEHVELNCAYKTKETYERNARLHLLPRIGDFKVVDIKPKDVNALYNDLKKEGYGKSLFYQVRNLLKSCLSYAVFPLEIIESNACDNVKSPKMEPAKKPKEIITPEKLPVILEASTRVYMFSSISIILFNTGMRIGELLGLQWDDIDFDKKIIHIRHSLLTKNCNEYELEVPKTPGSVRDIYFNEDVEKEFKKIKIEQMENRLKYGKFYIQNNDDDLVFTRKNGKFMSHTILENAARRVSKKVDIDFSLHTFRHSHATMMLEAGATMKDVQIRLGHASIEITMNIYVQPTDMSKKEALEKFNAYTKNSDI